MRIWQASKSGTYTRCISRNMTHIRRGIEMENIHKGRHISRGERKKSDKNILQSRFMLYTRATVTLI